MANHRYDDERYYLQMYRIYNSMNTLTITYILILTRIHACARTKPTPIFDIRMLWCDFGIKLENPLWYFRMYKLMFDFLQKKKRWNKKNGIFLDEYLMNWYFIEKKVSFAWVDFVENNMKTPLTNPFDTLNINSQKKIASFYFHSKIISSLICWKYLKQQTTKPNHSTR